MTPSRFLTVVAALLVVLALVAAPGCKAPAPGPAGNAPDNQAAAKMTESPKDAKSAQAKAANPTEAKEGLKDANPDVALEALNTLAEFMDGEDKQLAKDAYDAIMQEIRTSKIAMVRTSAIGMLGARATRFEKELIELTKSPDSTIQLAAIGSLRRCLLGSKGEARLQELSKSPVNEVKGAAVKALQDLRAGAGSDALVALVADLGNGEGDASAQAAIALKLKGHEVIPYLINAIRTSPSARQRHAATMCLALICAGVNPSQQRFGAAAHVTKKTLTATEKSNPVAVPVLIEALKDPEPMVREVAAQGLGYQGDARACGPLAAAMKDKDVHVRRRAAAALVTIPAKSVQPALEEAALKDPDVRVRHFAVEALGWIGDDSVAAPLARAAADRAAEVRRYAAMQLGRVAASQKAAQTTATLEALAKLFEDPDEDVRWAAVQAVASMHNPDAARYLVLALDDPVPQVANTAEAGLQKLGIGERNMPGMDE